MQKVLLASTALVLTTGWAMADVTNGGDGVGASITMSGYGEMGVVGGSDDQPGRDAAARFWTDVDIDFNMVGTTDGGLEFGVNIDLDESGDGSGSENGEIQSGEELWISGAFGRLTMGDTDGAYDWSLQETDIAHTLGDNEEEHFGFGNGNAGLDGFYDGQVARYEYAFGGFAVAVSAELSDFDDDDGAVFDGGGPILGLGAKYTFAFGGGDMTLGGGVQTVSDYANADIDATIYGISADLALAGGLRAIASYSAGTIDNTPGQGDLDPENYAIGIGYEMGPWLFAANYGHADEWLNGEVLDNDPNDLAAFRLDGEGYGLQANYDLGGGAMLVAGVAQNNPEFFNDGDDYTTYSFGVVMNF